MVRRRERLSDIKRVLDDSRVELRNRLLVETALMANSWDPGNRTAGRMALGATDAAKPVRLSRENLARTRTLRRALDGHKPALESLARELVADQDVAEGVRGIAAKLLSASSIVLIKEHIANPRRGRERELVDALESLDSRVIAPIVEDLEALARRSPYESVKRAALAVLARSRG